MTPRRPSLCIEAFQCVTLLTLLVASVWQLRQEERHDNTLRRLSSHQEESATQLAQLRQSLIDTQQTLLNMANGMYNLKNPAGGPTAVTGSAGFDISRQNLYLGDGMVMCFVQPLGVHMVLEGTDKGMTPHLCRGQGWEPEVSSVLRKLIRPGYNVLDVGTNVGYYTIMFAQLVGNTGRVIGIEANPRTHHLAERTLELLGYLYSNTQLLHRAAYSADNKVVKITAVKDRPLNNHVSEVQGDEASQPLTSTGVDVATVTVDTLVEPWKKLDVMKIDVEGAEAMVYGGMGKTLKRFPNVIIVMEVNTARMTLGPAKTFYETLQRDFPKLRRIVGSDIVDTSIDHLLANVHSDELLVLSKNPITL